MILNGNSDLQSKIKWQNNVQHVNMSELLIVLNTVKLGSHVPWIYASLDSVHVFISPAKSSVRTALKFPSIHACASCPLPQIEHKLACCCHLSTSNWKWFEKKLFSFIISYLLCFIMFYVVYGEITQLRYWKWSVFITCDEAETSLVVQVYVAVLYTMYGMKWMAAVNSTESKVFSVQ